MANDNKSGGIKKKAAAAASQKQTQKKEKRSLKEYLKGVRLEMKKVVWPTQKELGQYTALVLVACAFFALAFCYKLFSQLNIIAKKILYNFIFC